MAQETYQLEPKDSMMTFEFFSEGPKGNIKKRVYFQKTPQNDFYNLAFGDVNLVTDTIDDTVVTDNNDTEKVLATVAKTVDIFLTIYPDALVHAKGSTFTRTRLYRIVISSYLEEINKNFTIFGLFEDKSWAVYEKDKQYLAFIIAKNK